MDLFDLGTAFDVEAARWKTLPEDAPSPERDAIWARLENITRQIAEVPTTSMAELSVKARVAIHFHPDLAGEWRASLNKMIQASLVRDLMAAEGPQ